jgi:hypothetical protein
MFSAGARDEQTAKHFHAFGSRRAGVREFLAPRAVARALFVNARHAARRRNGRRTERSEEALTARVG